MSAIELGDIPPDLHRSTIKVLTSEGPITGYKWLMIQQDDAAVCLSKRQAEMLQLYLNDFIEGKV